MAGAGKDTFIGGGGFDYALYWNAASGVTINLANSALNTGEAAGDTYNSIEWVTGSVFNDSITGDANGNYLSSGGGVDTLNGGAGDDVYYVSAKDTVVESAGGGTDVVNFRFTEQGDSYTLADYVENLALTGTGNLNGTGNASANTITGNDSQNTLDGGVDAANDVLIGGKGDDTYIVRNAGDVITENASEGNDTVVVATSYTLAANVEVGRILAGVSGITLTANAAGNWLYSNGLANTLAGGTGSDYLMAGAGKDTFIGGGGFDSVLYWNAAAGVTINLANTALNTGEAAGDTYNSIEWISGSLLYNDNITGDANVNYLSGTGGINTLAGGAGNDVYYVGAKDTVTEAAAGGTDLVNFQFTDQGDSYTLADYAENLTLTGVGNLNGTGNTMANTIIGNAEANILAGGAGNDTLIGGNGADVYAMGRGDGGDLIQNGDADGGFDTLKFGSGIADDQLWFARSGSDLVVSIIGTSDSATIQGWYSATENQVDRIQVADGHYVNAGNVESLRSAMAAFSPPPLGQMTLDSTRASALATTLAASWH
jgi:Ca2+-binding RTX toxin-like protein